MFDAKPLPFRSLPGLSEKQLAIHYQLYLGYIEKTDEIRRQLVTAERNKANATYSYYRELKLEETFAVDGIKLHELYFYNLGGRGGPPAGRIAELIRSSFGSAQQWSDDFKAVALSARGWAMLVWDLDERLPRNFLQDTHNHGVVHRTIPLLALDMYEHAYYVDYPGDKAGYLNAFFSNINWDIVNARLRLYVSDHWTL